MNIEDYLYSQERIQARGAPDADALRQFDALVDAALLDVKLDTTVMSLWLLFDCRGTLNMEDGNTAVLAVQNVTEFQWSAEPLSTRRWRSIADWNPVTTAEYFSCEARILNVRDSLGDRLWMSGNFAEFHVGNIPGGDEAPPDFGSDSDVTIRARLASWQSEFTPIHASFTRS